MLAGCGCVSVLGMLVIAICGGLYATGLLMPVILQSMGIQRVGDTDALFSEDRIVPTVVIAAPSSQTRASLDFGTYGTQVLETTNLDTQILTGSTGNGIPVATVTLTEADVKALCAQRSAICREGTDIFSNVQFDLRPGGSIVYVDVDAGGIHQRIGVVMRMQPGQLAFEVVGVDIGGSTYDPATLPAFIPKDMRQRVQEAVADVERVGNEVLMSFTTTTGDETYRLTEVSIDHERVTLTLR